MPSIAGLKTTEWNTSRGEIPAIPALLKPLAESTTSAATKEPGIWACHHKKGTQREEHEHAKMATEVVEVVVVVVVVVRTRC